jgi:hypothetical protein
VGAVALLDAVAYSTGLELHPRGSERAASEPFLGEPDPSSIRSDTSGPAPIRRGASAGAPPLRRPVF